MTKRNPGTNSNDAPAQVQHLLAKAVGEGMTDLYVLPGIEATHVRGRLASGATVDIRTLEPAAAIQCTARIKVLAGMLTYRTSMPQDGVIRNVEECDTAEFRVASLPTETGERLTLRILHAAAGPRHLEDLGFTPAAEAAMRGLLTHASGLLVLTGPTGSGKTTTIYAMIRELLRQGHSPATLISIEDPVESLVPGISQVQLQRENPEWSYAQALKAALRHDVKTLVIGELRDREVTKVALDAALTGHRVITTYHAGDVAGVYARLLHQGFEPFLIAAAIQGVVAQRLVAAVDRPLPVPVAAVLAADDAWREFIMTSPGFCELRQRLTKVPEADLEAQARLLVAAGQIHEKEAYLI